MPGTPLGVRRGQAPGPGDLHTMGTGQVTRGGSLERNKRAAEARGVSEAYSDTEYVQVLLDVSLGCILVIMNFRTSDSLECTAPRVCPRRVQP